MGTRGPVPKRSGARAGHRAAHEQPRKVESFSPVAVPPPLDDWHDRAKDFYAALDQSGQARTYEPSDWQKALLVASMVSAVWTNLDTHGTLPNAPQLVALDKMMDSLLVTEAARRRAGLEVDRLTTSNGADAPAAAPKSRIAERIAKLGG